MKKAIPVFAVLMLCAVWMWPPKPLATAADDKDVRFDVNDVSFLWPVPKTKEDVAKLISVDEKLADGQASILPQKDFDVLISVPLGASVKDSAERETKIIFDGRLKEQFSKRSTWKIAAFRVDPSAPGTAPKLVEARGRLPQLRLIIQPVTVEGDTVTVHDVTAHIVYNYVKEFKKPVSGKGPFIAVPDEEKFGAIVKDLVSLKETVTKSDGKTEGKLSVHPGFKGNIKGFTEQVKSFLQKHLSDKGPGAMALMGLNEPEPWIFVGMLRNPKDGQFILAPNENLGGGPAQMLTFRGGIPVMPRPTTTNIDEKRGVSTALLFPAFNAKVDLEKEVFADPELKHKDIPDLIANPREANFFNTDCVSCHTESSRRNDLKIRAGESKFAYKLPQGISGVDESLLPRRKWNVRNFGWFFDAATATLRTANEAAESAEYINEKYLGRKKD